MVGVGRRLALKVLEIWHPIIHPQSPHADTVNAILVVYPLKHRWGEKLYILNLFSYRLLKRNHDTRNHGPNNHRNLRRISCQPFWRNPKTPPQLGVSKPLLQEKLPQYGSPYLLGKLSGTHGTQTQMGVKIDGKIWPNCEVFLRKKTLNWQSSSHIWWLQKSETKTQKTHQLIMARSIISWSWPGLSSTWVQQLHLVAILEHPEKRSHSFTGLH